MKTRVAFAKCAQYNPEDITAALEKAFAALGGLAQFIPRGGTVLIKPNLLTDREPKKAATTHPEIVRALIRMVRQHGGNPIVGDSPAGAMNHACGLARLDSVLEKTGFRALCAEENTRLVILEKEPLVACAYQGIPLGITKAAFEADLIINVPKLKTHSFTLFTNAVKNVFGLLPGFQKALLHKSFPNPRAFGECLAFLYAQIKPGLTVCDAVIGMEGNGPSCGTSVQLGFLAASADGVALDVALCRMLKINENKIAYLEALRRMGIGESDPDNIELTGDYQELRGIRPIKQPGMASVARYIPAWLVKLVEPYIWFIPAFSEKCTACKRCVQACPVKALTLAGTSKPVVDRKKCIGCCCCHEVCPESAIKMTYSPLLSLARCIR